MDDMSSFQAMYLKFGSEILSHRVFSSQPSTIFVSDGVPAAWNFFREMMSFLVISSEVSSGLETVLLQLIWLCLL
jgi:hypothetical protein